MRMPGRARHQPGRLAAGAFILNSGITKWSADAETAARLHRMASGTYPFLAGIPPERFVRLLAAGEIALGSALLVPVIPAAAAGGGLAAFASGLLGMYLRTPGLRRPGSIRPAPPGVPIAKDVWLLGIGLGLVMDALTDSPDGSGPAPVS